MERQWERHWKKRGQNARGPTDAKDVKIEEGPPCPPARALSCPSPPNRRPPLTHLPPASALIGRATGRARPAGQLSFKASTSFGSQSTSIWLSVKPFLA